MPADSDFSLLLEDNKDHPAFNDNMFKTWVDGLDDTQKSAMTAGDAFDQYTVHVQKAAKESSAFSRVTSKLGNLAKSVGSTMLNMGVTMLASWALGEVITAIDNYIHRVEIAIEKGKEARETIASISEGFTSKQNTVDQNLDRYIELASGVDTTTNENRTLSTEEYQEFVNIQNELASIFPQIVTGVDAQGNMITSLGDNASYASMQLEQLLEQERQIANFEISENLQTAVKGGMLEIQQYYKELKNLQDQVDTYEALSNSSQNILNGADSLTGLGFDVGDGVISIQDFAAYDDQQAMEFMYERKNALIKAAEKVGLSDVLSDITTNDVIQDDEWGQQWNASLAIPQENLEQFKDAYIAALSEYSSDISEANTNAINQMAVDEKEMAATWNSLSESIISSMSVYEDYNNLSDETKQAINSAIQNFDYIDEFIDESGNLNLPDVRQYFRESLLDPITDAVDSVDTLEEKNKIQNAIDDLFNLDTSDMSVKDYKHNVTQLVKDIVGDGEDVETINKRLDLKTSFGFTYIKDGHEYFNIDDIAYDLGQQLQIDEGVLKDELSVGELFQLDDLVQMGQLNFQDYGDIDALIEYLRGAQDAINNIEPITFASLFETTGEGSINEIVDNFQSDISSIKDILDQLSSGEDVDLTDLIQQFPELAGQADNLDESLGNLSLDKIKEFSEQYSEAISSITDPEQRKLASDMFQDLISDIDLSKVDFTNLNQQLFDNLFSGNESDRGSTYAKIQKLIDNFATTENGQEILLKLSLDPSAADWTFSEWISQINKHAEVTLSVNIEDTQNVLSKINASKSALLSQSSGLSIDLDTFNSDELKDYQSALEYVNGTMQLNADKVREITKAKAEEVISQNNLNKAQAQAQYLENVREINELREALENVEKTSQIYSDTMSQIDSLSLENDSIVDQCKQWDLLNSSIQEATGEYQAWLDIQSGSDYGDMFDDTLSAIEQLRNPYHEDSDQYMQFGSKKWDAAVDFIVPDSVDHEDTDAVSDYFQNLKRYLTFDENGTAIGMDIGTFLSDAVNSGLMTVDGEEYEINPGITMDDFRTKLTNDLGETVELSEGVLQAFFDELQLYGGEFSWADEYGKTFGDMAVSANEASEALRSLDKYKNLDIQLDVSNLNTPEEQISTLEGTIQEMQGIKVTPGVDASEIEYANSIIEYCVAQMQYLQAPVVMSVDTSIVQGQIGEAVSLLQQFQEAQNIVEMKTALGLDTSEAQASVDSIVAQLQSQNPQIMAELEIDTSDASTIEASLSSMTPEILVHAGIDETAIIGYTPNDKDATVVFGKDSTEPDGYKPDDKHATVIFGVNHTAVDMYNPSNLNRTVTYNIVTNGTPPSGGSGNVSGTAHVLGTANNSLSRIHNYGRAALSGDWGTKRSGRTLVGELGREIVVDPHTGKWYTVGDNGAEFVDIPKDAIVFNHIQSQSLLEQGWVNSRATAMARRNTLATGTAMVTGGIKWPGTSSGASSSTSSGSSGSSVSNAVSSASKTASKAASKATKENKEVAESIDWIVRAIEAVERQIDRMDLRAGSTYRSFSTRNSSLSKEIGHITDEIELQEKAYKRYQKEANSVGLSKKYKDRVKNGTIDIESISNENTREKIEEFQKWWDKRNESYDAMDQLKEDLSAAYEEAFDLVATQYDGILSQFEHQKNLLEGYVEQAEQLGYMASTGYYDALIKNENQNLSNLKKEQQALINQLNTGVNSGAIKTGTEAWNEMQSQINEVTEAIQESETALVEFNNEIRQIQWDRFDYMQESVSRLTEEAEFFADLMSNDQLFDDKGFANDNAWATLGMYGQNYNTYMEQALSYAREIQSIEKEMAKDPYDTELIKRRDELLDQQREMILAAEDEKNSIKDLVEEGINAQLEALQELIDKYKEAINSQKDLYDFQKNIADQTKEVAKLQKQLSAYAGDTSEEGRSRLQQTQTELEEAQANLEETQYDQWISDQEALLDNLYSEYENILNQRLDNLDQLVTDVITAINEKSDIISATLQTEAANVGYTISDNMTQLWSSTESAGATGIKDVLTTYIGNFTAYAGNFQAFAQTQGAATTAMQLVLGNVYTELSKLVSGSDKEAKENVKKATSTSNQAKGSTTTTSSANKNTSTNKNTSNKNTTSKKSSSGGDGKAKVGDRVTFVSGRYYEDSYGQGNSGYQYRGKKVYITKINKSGSHPYHISTGKKLGSGDLGWLKLSQLKGYKTGVRSVIGDQIAWTNEAGPEAIIRPSDGSMLVRLQNRDQVLNADATDNLYRLTNNPTSFITDALKNTVLPDISNIVGGTVENSINMNFNLPNVKNYDEFISTMQKDHRFEKMIQDMTVGQIANRGTFAKMKYNFKR